MPGAERWAYFGSASPAAPVRFGSPLPATPAQMGARMDWARVALLTAALVFPIWGMRPLDFVKFGDIKFEYLMILATLAATLAVAESGTLGGFGFRRSVWLWALGGMVVVSLAASLAANDPVTAVNGSFMRRDGFLMVLANSMLFLTAYRLTQQGAWNWGAESVTRCLVAAGVPVFAYAVSQSLGNDPYMWEPDRGAGGRVFSTLGNPIFLGAYAATVTFVAIGLWMESRPGPLGGLWLVAAGLGTAVTILTASRASWFGLAVGLIALAGLSIRRGRARKGAAGVLAAGVVATLLVGGVLVLAPDDRATTVGGSAATLVQPGASRNSGRMAIWAISLRMIADHPFLGVGPDSMGRRFEEYRTKEYDQAEGPDRLADKPHSSLLEWGVETGILGAVLTSGLVAAILAAAGWALYRQRRVESGYWTLAGVWAGACAYMLQSTITVTAIGVDGVWWILLGILAGWLVAAADTGAGVIA
ncbi:MAG: O-antigen ligase family protein [Thermoleophilia bacterium]